VAAWEDAVARGEGAVGRDGRMIDAANIRMARTTLRRVEAIQSRTPEAGR
jgi:citrate lyase beta subunit